MDKLQKLQEAKRKIITYVDSGIEPVPTKIIELLNECFIQLSKYYEKIECSNANIEEYMSGAMDELKEEIKNYPGKIRKDDIMKQAQILFAGLEQKVKSEIELPKELPSKIESDSREASGQIMDLLKDKVYDVMSRQSKILSSRGYPQVKIDIAQQGSMYILSQFISRNQENIADLIKKDDKKLEEIINEEYERIVEEPTKEEEFRQEIKAEDLTLEVQRENAEKFAKKKEEEEKDKTKGKYLADYLPESTLD